MQRERAQKALSSEGYEYVTDSGDRYCIIYSPPPQTSLRNKDGHLNYYAAGDHFFLVVKGNQEPPKQVVVVPILSSVYSSYKHTTGRKLCEDEKLVIELCVDRIEAALEQGTDLLKASELIILPGESPLVVRPGHLHKYIPPNPYIGGKANS